MDLQLRRWSQWKAVRYGRDARGTTSESKSINSLAANKRRALIQMATGSGKTYTAVNFVYRSSSSPARAESSSSSTAATSATRP